MEVEKLPAQRMPHRLLKEETLKGKEQQLHWGAFSARRMSSMRGHQTT